MTKRTIPRGAPCHLWPVPCDAWSFPRYSSRGLRFGSCDRADSCTDRCLRRR